MRIVTWNVNSLRAREDYVRLYLEERAPDVLCLQELRADVEDLPLQLLEDHGYRWTVRAQKQRNGVLIAGRGAACELVDPVEGHAGIEEADDARFVAATVAGLRIVNVYCPQGQSTDSPQFPYKLRFFEGLRAWLEADALRAEPLVVLGDLNVARHPEDVWSVDAVAGVPTFHPEEHARWDGLLELGLADAVRPWIDPGTYSFWDYRGGAFRFGQGFRIDHVLVARELLPRIGGAEIERPWRKKRDGLTASDHAPVAVEIDA